MGDSWASQLSTLYLRFSILTVYVKGIKMLNW